MARTHRSGGRRTDYTWAHFGDLELSQDLGVSTAVLGATEFIFGETQTLMRFRGRVGVYLDAGGADERVMILCGLTVLNGDNTNAPEIFNTGVVNDEASWIWQGSFWLHSGAGVLAPEEFGQFGSIEIDSKAMRKVKANEKLVFVFQAPADLVSDQTGTFDLGWQVHFLKGR